MSACQRALLLYSMVCEACDSPVTFFPPLLRRKPYKLWSTTEKHHKIKKFPNYHGKRRPTFHHTLCFFTLLGVITKSSPQTTHFTTIIRKRYLNFAAHFSQNRIGSHCNNNK